MIIAPRLRLKVSGRPLKGPPLNLQPQPSAKNAVAHEAAHAMARGQMPCIFGEKASVDLCEMGGNFDKLNFQLSKVDR